MAMPVLAFQKTRFRGKNDGPPNLVQGEKAAGWWQQGERDEAQAR